MSTPLLPLRWRNKLIMLCARNRLVICNARIQHGEPITPSKGSDKGLLYGNVFIGPFDGAAIEIRGRS